MRRSRRRAAGGDRRRCRASRPRCSSPPKTACAWCRPSGKCRSAEGAVAQARSILEAQLVAEPPAPLVVDHPERRECCAASSCRTQRSVRRSRPGDSHQRIPAARIQELMTVYTIVNALLTNLPKLQEVQILIGGQEVDTLAGHVDLRRPLRKNEGLIRRHVHSHQSPMTRLYDRAPDELRPTTITPELHRPRRRLGADRSRPHARHLQGQHRRQGAAVSARHRQGLGDGGIRHAAARHDDAIQTARRRRARSAAGRWRSSG